MDPREILFGRFGRFGVRFGWIVETIEEHVEGRRRFVEFESFGFFV